MLGWGMCPVSLCADEMIDTRFLLPGGYGMRGGTGQGVYSTRSHRINALLGQRLVNKQRTFSIGMVKGLI